MATDPDDPNSPNYPGSAEEGTGLAGAIHECMIEAFAQPINAEAERNTYKFHDALAKAFMQQLPDIFVLLLGDCDGQRVHGGRTIGEHLELKASSDLIPPAEGNPSEGQIRMLSDVEMANNSIDSVKSITFNELINDPTLSGSTTNIDWSTGHRRTTSIVADTTLTFTAPGGPANLILKVTQSATLGSAITWPGNVKFAGSDVISTGVGSVDVITLFFDGSSYFGIINKDFT